MSSGHYGLVIQHGSTRVIEGRSSRTFCAMFRRTSGSEGGVGMMGGLASGSEGGVNTRPCRKLLMTEVPGQWKRLKSRGTQLSVRCEAKRSTS